MYWQRGYHSGVCRHQLLCGEHTCTSFCCSCSCSRSCSVSSLLASVDSNSKNRPTYKSLLAGCTLLSVCCRVRRVCRSRGQSKVRGNNMDGRTSSRTALPTISSSFVRMKSAWSSSMDFSFLSKGIGSGTAAYTSARAMQGRCTAAETAAGIVVVSWVQRSGKGRVHSRAKGQASRDGALSSVASGETNGCHVCVRHRVSVGYYAAVCAGTLPQGRSRWARRSR